MNTVSGIQNNIRRFCFDQRTNRIAAISVVPAVSSQKCNLHFTPMISFIRLNNTFQTVIHKIMIFQSRFSDFAG
jgi:hypothetical protein